MGTILMKYLKVALSLAGSAILLFSCGESGQQTDEAANEAMMTEYSENLLIVMSQNGRKSYVFTTPLVEGYTLGAEPYREFRKGVKIPTYKDDSLSSVDAVLTANYAIYYENRELWEAKGNVVVEKSDGKTLYTQQLFWNARTGKIYSNVDSKIVQNGGRDVFIGEGFEFYYGAGANLGSWDYDDGEFTFGVNGIIGLEYKIREFPLAFSLDYKPNLNVIGKTGFHAADFGLGIRVAF